jgi:hypothetical protein
MRTRWLYAALLLVAVSVASVHVFSRGGVLGNSVRQPLRRHGSVVLTTQKAASETT